MTKQILPPVSAALSATVLAGLFAVAGQAATGSVLSIAVKDENGIPVRDAVVMIYPASGSSIGASSFAGNGVMQQRNIQFDPGTLIVARGTNVRFPNRDRVRHSVYSFSPAGKFEMKLYGRDETRSKQFSVAGTVALGCNIHDEMKGYIKVVDTPFAAKSDHNGQVRIADLPGGQARVKIWHPQNRVRGGESAYSLSLDANGFIAKTVTLKLRK
tara:strand:+ start:1147 stop:1788 length:642 start_codon:yes stop_codon:yes gene_type:complete